MKKYRLVEYNSLEEYSTEKETFDSLEQASRALIKAQSSNKWLYYRIEEVKESIMDRVKFHEDAWKIKYGDTNGLHIRNNYVDKLIRLSNKATAKQLIALIDLEIITTALNEGWKPDWEDEGQEKWFVFYDFEFRKILKTYCRTTTTIFPRLYFKSRELAEYAATQFAELYKQLLIEKF